MRLAISHYTLIAMTKRTRRGLFYGLIALFIVVGTAMILYAEGWRLDLGTGYVTKIGAIYVRSYPEDASISLNNKPVQNKSGFFSPGTLISDLFPKTYNLQLSAAGFAPWQERVTVLPSLVIPLKYAVLVPDVSTTTATGSIVNFFASQGSIVEEDLSGDVAADGTVVGQGALVAATADTRAFIFKNVTSGYHLYSVSDATSTNLSATLAKDGISASMVQNVILDPHDSSNILVIGQKKIWLLNLEDQSLTLIEKTPAAETLSPAIAMDDSSIVWTRLEPASDTSEIMLYDRAAGALRETSTTITGTTQKIGWIRNGEFGFLQSDGSFYLYDSNADTLQKLADNVKDFSASADGSMVAALEYSSTEIFTQGDPTGYYRFNLPETPQIQRLIWYKDDNHLFVVYPDHISFLDLEDAGLNNFTTVASGALPFYDPTSNFLYFISPSGQLLRLDFPI